MGVSRVFICHLDPGLVNFVMREFRNSCTVLLKGILRRSRRCAQIRWATSPAGLDRSPKLTSFLGSLSNVRLRFCGRRGESPRARRLLSSSSHGVKLARRGTSALLGRDCTRPPVTKGRVRARPGARLRGIWRLAVVWRDYKPMGRDGYSREGTIEDVESE